MTDIITTIDGTDYEYMTFSDRHALNVGDTVAVRTGSLTENYDLLTVTKKTKTQITLSDGERYVIRTGHKYGSQSTRPRYIAGRAVTETEPTVEQMTENTLGGAALAEPVAKKIVAELTERFGENTANYERIIHAESGIDDEYRKPFGITRNAVTAPYIEDITAITETELHNHRAIAEHAATVESHNLMIEREYSLKTRMGMKQAQHRLDSWRSTIRWIDTEIERRAKIARPQTLTESLSVGERVHVSDGIDHDSVHTVTEVTDDYVQIDDEHRTRFTRETGRQVNTSTPRYIIRRALMHMPPVAETPLHEKPLLKLGDTVETVGQLHDLVVGSLVLDEHGNTYRLGFTSKLRPSIIMQLRIGHTDYYDFETVKGSQTQLDGARVVFVPSK